MTTRIEVSKHASRGNCWVIIKNHAYDVTNFLDAHPGGTAIILKYAGKDATQAFEPLHSDDTLEKYLKPEQHIGLVTGPVSMNNEMVAEVVKVKPQQPGQAGKRRKLRSILNLHDFEIAASQMLPERAYAFFKAGADDEGSVRWNQKSWSAVRFRPRVLKPLENIEISTSILGCRFDAPFFICPAGGGKLAHPTGETLMTKAASKANILQWVCNNAGCTQRQMADARGEGQVLFWQIYAMTDLAKTEKEIRQAVELGYKGFALTVDAIQVGKRERDMRLSHSDEELEDEDDEDAEAGLSGGISVSRPTIYPSFDWISAVKWLRSMTDLPIAIKGIQAWEDAALCMEFGVHPWLSNHGGRQLDGAPSAVETLVEIRHHCPEVFERCEVIVDGGITRGTDIVKALALGAKAVGLGRGFLYALVLGEAGITRAVHILKHEVTTALGMLGVTSVDQLRHTHVDTTGLSHAAGVARARL